MSVTITRERAATTTSDEGVGRGVADHGCSARHW
jgi:hypothetical protein